MVMTSTSNAGGAGLISGQGVRISHASQPKIPNIKQKQCCNKFSKDFKNGPHQKKKKKFHSAVLPKAEVRPVYLPCIGSGKL